MPAAGVNGEKEVVVVEGKGGGSTGSTSSDDDGFFTSAVSVQHKVKTQPINSIKSWESFFNDIWGRRR